MIVIEFPFVKRWHMRGREATVSPIMSKWFSGNVGWESVKCQRKKPFKKHLLPLAPSRQPEKVNINLARPLHLAKSQHLAHGCFQCSHLNETPTPTMFKNEDGYKEDINVQNNDKKCSSLLPFLPLPSFINVKMSSQHESLKLYKKTRKSSTIHRPNHRET